MGWSCTAKAMRTLDHIEDELCGDTEHGSNAWAERKHVYFFEIGDEQRDGAITGSIWRFTSDGQHATRSQSFRIEPDGRLARGPASWRRVVEQRSESTWR